MSVCVREGGLGEREGGTDMDGCMEEGRSDGGSSVCVRVDGWAGRRRGGRGYSSGSLTLVIVIRGQCAPFFFMWEERRWRSGITTRANSVHPK